MILEGLTHFICKFALASWGRGCTLGGGTSLNYFSLLPFKLIPNTHSEFNFISNLHVKFLFDWILNNIIVCLCDKTNFSKGKFFPY